jgi:hypothetical protein
MPVQRACSVLDLGYSSGKDGDDGRGRDKVRDRVV